MQQAHHTQHIASILLRQPPPRPFTLATEGARLADPLANASDAALVAECDGYAKLERLVLMLKALRYPRGAGGAPQSQRKVLIVPPAHKDVREKLIDGLRLVGACACARTAPTISPCCTAV